MRYSPEEREEIRKLVFDKICTEVESATAAFNRTKFITEGILENKGNGLSEEEKQELLKSQKDLWKRKLDDVKKDIHNNKYGMQMELRIKLSIYLKLTIKKDVDDYIRANAKEHTIRRSEIISLKMGDIDFGLKKRKDEPAKAKEYDDDNELKADDDDEDDEEKDDEGDGNNVDEEMKDVKNANERAAKMDEFEKFVEETERGIEKWEKYFGLKPARERQPNVSDAADDGAP